MAEIIDNRKEFVTVRHTGKEVRPIEFVEVVEGKKVKHEFTFGSVHDIGRTGKGVFATEQKIEKRIWKIALQDPAIDALHKDGTFAVYGDAGL